MALGKRYCPTWVYDCVVAQSVIDFISYKVDLIQPCKKYSDGLSKLYEEVSLEEMVRASELVVSFFSQKIKWAKTQLTFCQVLGSSGSIMFQGTKNVSLAGCLGPAIRMTAETTQVI